MHTYTFHKNERLCSKRAIDGLFAGGAHSFSCFPIRAVFKLADESTVQASESLLMETGLFPSPQQSRLTAAPPPVAQVLMSVGKRKLRHAVDRNRAKRQLREAYRLNKHILGSCCPPDGGQQRLLHIAFVWLSDSPVSSQRVHKAMRTLLDRISQTVGQE